MEITIRDFEVGKISLNSKYSMDKWIPVAKEQGGWSMNRIFLRGNIKVREMLLRPT
jgi:hypothetical protein